MNCPKAAKPHPSFPQRRRRRVCVLFPCICFPALLGRSVSPCLDKPVLVRDAHDSKARPMATVPGTAMLAMAEHHIQTNGMGL